MNRKITRRISVILTILAIYTFQTRNNYRPSVRRPSLNVQKTRVSSLNNDVTADVIPSTTTANVVRKRTRPTTTATTTTATKSSVSSPGGIKRKYSDRGRNPGKTTKTSADGISYIQILLLQIFFIVIIHHPIYIATVPPVTTEVARTPNPLFRRRFGYSASTRRSITTTTADPVTERTALPAVDNIDRSSNEDQEIEPSFQDSKFTKTRYNQIGEVLTDDVVEAITSLSRAPVPVMITSTSKYGRFTHHGYDVTEEEETTSRQATSPRMSMLTTSTCNVLV